MSCRWRAPHAHLRERGGLFCQNQIDFALFEFAVWTFRRLRSSSSRVATSRCDSMRGTAIVHRATNQRCVLPKRP